MSRTPPPSIPIELPILGAYVDTLSIARKNLVFKGISSYTDDLLSTLVEIAIAILINIINCGLDVIISTLPGIIPSILGTIASVFGFPFSGDMTLGEYLSLLFNTRQFKDGLQLQLKNTIIPATRELFVEIPLKESGKVVPKWLSILPTCSKIPTVLHAKVCNFDVPLLSTELYKNLDIDIDCNRTHLPAQFCDTCKSIGPLTAQLKIKKSC